MTKNFHQIMKKNKITTENKQSKKKNTKTHDKEQKSKIKNNYRKTQPKEQTNAQLQIKETVTHFVFSVGTLTSL